MTVSLPTMDTTQTTCLWDHAGSYTIAPVPTSRQGTTQYLCQLSYNRPSLWDAHCTPLQHHYGGPNNFMVDIRSKTEVITVDRLNLAHLDVDSPIQLAQPCPCSQPKLPACISTPQLYPHNTPGQLQVGQFVVLDDNPQFGLEGSNVQ